MSSRNRCRLLRLEAPVPPADAPQVDDPRSGAWIASCSPATPACAAAQADRHYGYSTAKHVVVCSPTVALGCGSLPKDTLDLQSGLRSHCLASPRELRSTPSLLGGRIEHLGRTGHAPAHLHQFAKACLDTVPGTPRPLGRARNHHQGFGNWSSAPGRGVQPQATLARCKCTAGRPSCGGPARRRVRSSAHPAGRRIGRRSCLGRCWPKPLWWTLSPR